MVRTRLLAVLVVATGVAGPAAATDVYKTVDSNGVVHYSDQPPSKNAKPVALPPIQVVGPVSKGAAESSASAAPAGPDMTGGAPLSVSIVSPAPDETFRSDDRVLPVSVRMNQTLPQGYGLLYMLDGTAQNGKPTRALNYSLEGVERGEHMVTVVTVNAAGKEVGRAAPVIVHMKPPTVQITQQRKEEREANRPRPRPRNPTP